MSPSQPPPPPPSRLHLCSRNKRRWSGILSAIERKVLAKLFQTIQAILPSHYSLVYSSAASTAAAAM